jgi:hypothetical protein
MSILRTVRAVNGVSPLFPSGEATLGSAGCRNSKFFAWSWRKTWEDRHGDTVTR